MGQSEREWACGNSKYGDGTLLINIFLYEHHIFIIWILEDVAHFGGALAWPKAH